MQLSQFKPRWVGTKESQAQGRKGMGMSFRCPGCGEVRLSVWFANPVDGGVAHPADPVPEGATEEEKNYIFSRNNRWLRTGESFEVLSLSPSVDASKAGHWHGMVTAGQVSGDGPCALRKQTPAG